MSNENDRSGFGGSKHNEYTPAPQIWVGDGKVVTLQTNGPISVYSERSPKDGSVKTQTFLKTTR